MMSDDRNEDAMQGWIAEPEMLYQYDPPPWFDVRNTPTGHVRGLQTRVATLEAQLKFLQDRCMELIEAQEKMAREIHVIKYPCH